MMSESVAPEYNEGNKSRDMSELKGSGDEEKENVEGILDLPLVESLMISTTVSTVPATTDQFMYTPEFRRHFVEFVTGDTLMTLRLATKGWRAAADAFIDEGVKSGAMMVHGGTAISMISDAREERHKLVTRVIFLLNITKVGDYACFKARNLVVVDIPEGIESIGKLAFHNCSSLTTVSFPTTLTSIDDYAFTRCTSLENVDLLHTNLQEKGNMAFYECSELKSMTIPDSLQTIGTMVFYHCSKLVPSNVDFHDEGAVVAYLRSKQTTS
ncbi:hypothetical protein TL16_g12492 [Triparma laevis f. inornata]|uniref:Uncharacterized protein n=1 Tax=Triparma laevis f. inornata TaxID=1714386 RepID=A0A9W7EV69_9STRA|nr:hypothetical protein TL16_g12492 [Triparma laevis f. inornata]